MLPKDFRGYLEYLEAKGMLCRVSKEIDVKYEIAAGIRKVSDTDGPALLFENIKGYPGWRVAGGIFATRRLMALALETEPDEKKLLQRYLEFDQKRVKPKLVSTSPLKEIIIKGDEVDLTKLPVPTYCEKDSGPYIIPAADICRDPATGLQNVTIDRREVRGKNITAAETPPPQQMGLIFENAEARGESVGVACVLGAPVEVSLASQVKAPLGVDETEIAGAIRGEPIEVVKCETIDVDVPAHAEIVIEGITIPGERVLDGPFGEWRGDYRSWVDIWYAECFVVKITAITMRKDAIFQAMAAGMPMTEDQWMRKWTLAADDYRELERMLPYPDDIKGVNFTEGSGTANLVVSIKKRTERQPRDIIYRLLTRYTAPYNVIVVDDDVDVYDHRDVERAWATRIVPQRDIIIPQLSSETYLMFAKKWGIDATLPLKEREAGTKAVPPGVDKVDYV